MTKDLARQRELQPMALCEPCQGIQRNWRKARLLLHRAMQDG